MSVSASSRSPRSCLCSALRSVAAASAARCVCLLSLLLSLCALTRVSLVDGLGGEEERIAVHGGEGV